MTDPARGTAADWDQRYAQGSPWHAGPNVTVREVVSALPPGRARDVACGDGRHSIWLAGLGWSVDAVDFSAVAVERGRETAERLAADGALPGPIRWAVADVSTDRPEPGSADLVLLSFVHLPPDQARSTLELSASALAPGGRLLLVGHDRTNLTAGVGGPRRHEVLTDPDEVAEVLTGAGLRVERAEIVRRSVAGADRDALDTVVEAVRPVPD
ncbi:class I SAM-dependent methyltransferase [Actinotalea sp. M2MS4P-6]|uniref:class I SAM-dependent methyltransferase n=1 Tax=Actinotalea sp. M2MS4P-6 TaxID=2983762 RepID=UPI0021E39501|nr:class I SAM-dependent methyltransferase [Actinotalea sp. M2MS4P-6]MCV2395002.1 class I SAM-dependent methyltransferase [Actinotalea sp. M2MS4P-6]